MAESTFRTIELMDIGSLGKETIFNDAVENLARGISGLITIDLTGLSTLTLLSDTDDLSLYYIVILSGTLAAPCTLILPEDESRANIWVNRTTGDQDVLVTMPDMLSNVTVPSGTHSITFSDGETVIPVIVTGNDAVPQGTPGRLVRYRSDGLALEQTGWQITDGGALLGPVQTAIVQSLVSGELLAVSDQHSPAIGSVAYGTSLAPRLVGRRARGTRTLPTAVQSDDALLIMEAVGHDGSALGAPVATVELQTEETFTGAAKGTRVVMKTTASGTTTPVERLRLTGNGRLSLGIPDPAPSSNLHILVESEQGGITNESYFTNSGGANLQFRKAFGSQASPQLVPVNANMGGLRTWAYVRNAADTTNEFTILARQAHELDSVDAQGRAGGRWRLLLSPGVSAAEAEVLRVSEAGNLGLGQPSFGTGATKTLALGAGVAPSTSPADSVQLTAVDRGGTAGKRSLLIRTEDGTTHVLGDVSGIATTLSATLGSGASYQILNAKGAVLLVADSTVQERAQALLGVMWVDNTDATRKARLTLSAYDDTAAREAIRLEADGSAAKLGFFGTAAAGQQTGGAATAGGTYGATEQTMLQKVYDALRTFGLLS